MHVPFQLKVPVSIAVDLQERLRALTAAHEKDMAEIEKKFKLANGDPDVLAKQRDHLFQRGRTLSMNNMMRLAVQHGAAKVVLMKDTEIFRHLAESGLARGRPSGR